MKKIKTKIIIIFFYKKFIIIILKNCFPGFCRQNNFPGGKWNAGNPGNSCIFGQPLQLSVSNQFPPLNLFGFSFRFALLLSPFDSGIL
jgi:hypothetical protein